MRRPVTKASLAAGLLLLPISAEAGKPVPEFSKVTVNVSITLVQKGKSGTSTSSISHKYLGQCVLLASQAFPGDLMTGNPVQVDTSSIEAKSKDATVKLQQPDMQEYMKQVQAEILACGNDQACIMKAGQKLMQDPRAATLQGVEKDAAAVGQDMQGLQRESNLQVFGVEGCTGTIEADDQHFVDDPGGEGGGGAYQETIKVKGRQKVDLSRTLHGHVKIHGDFKVDQTVLFIEAPPNTTMPATSSLKGKYEDDLVFFPSGVHWENQYGPVAGFLKPGSKKFEIPGGTMTVEWKIKRGG